MAGGGRLTSSPIPTVDVGGKGVSAACSGSPAAHMNELSSSSVVDLSIFARRGALGALGGPLGASPWMGGGSGEPARRALVGTRASQFEQVS